MRLVRWLFGLSVVATVLWGGYWFVGARALQMAVDEVLAAPGSPIRADAAEVRGFPNRFDITLTRPELREGGLTWTAPFAQIFALSYRPHHVVAVFPPEQRFTLGGLDWLVGTSDARASVVMAPTRSLELDRAVLVLAGLEIDGPTRLRADALRGALRLAAPGRYEAVAELEVAFPDAALLDARDPDRLLPRRFDVLRVDAELAFDRPLDLNAATTGALPPPAVALTGARAAWEGVDLRLTGRVDLDAPGGPAGDVVLAVTGWRMLLDTLDRAGVLSPEQSGWLNAAGPGLARADDPDAVDIPLRIEAGQVRMGPLVLFDLAAG